MRTRSVRSDRLLVVSLLLATIACSHPSFAQARDSTWRDHDRAGRAARERGDWRAALHHAEVLDSLLYGNPRVTLAIARASANLRDTVRALAALSRYATMGLTYDVTADSQLSWLTGTKSFPGIHQRFRDNAGGRMDLRRIATMPREDFIAEGIAYDEKRQRLLVSSIRYGSVMTVTRDGMVREFLDLRREGAWAALALAIDAARDRLWVTSMWYPHTEGLSQSDSGRSSVLLYQLSTGLRLQRFDLPRGNHEPGDICVAPNGDLFVSDGRAGTVSVVREGSDSLAILVPPGELVSPQGCAVDGANGRQRLLVADYALGIAGVDVSNGKVTWLPRSTFVAATGIDGLLLDGDRLVGVQNGVEPNRVVALHLDADHESISSVAVIAQDSATVHEPTHVTIMGGEVVFVANGGFAKFDVSTGRQRPGTTLHAPALVVIPRRMWAMRVDTARVKQELMALDAGMSRRPAPADFLSSAMPNAPILMPQQPILRAEAARGAIVSRYGGVGTTYTWQPLHAVAGADGLFGCTMGTSRFKASDTSRTRAGSYVTCWQRRSTGDSWRIAAHSRSDSQSDSSSHYAAAPRLTPRSVSEHDGAQDIEGALAADESFARRGSLAAGPAPAFAAYVASDGMLVVPPAFPSGPQGMRDAFTNFSPARVLLWYPDRTFAGGSGGLAFTVGYSLSRERSGQGAQSAGKYFSVWRKSPTGRWEFILDQGTPGR